MYRILLVFLVSIFGIAAAGLAQGPSNPLPNTCLCFVEPVFEDFGTETVTVEEAWVEIIYTPAVWREEVVQVQVSPTGQTVLEECLTCVVDTPAEFTSVVKRVKTKDESWETIDHPAKTQIVTKKIIKHQGGWLNVPTGQCEKGVFRPVIKEEVRIGG